MRHLLHRRNRRSKPEARSVHFEVLVSVVVGRIWELKPGQAVVTGRRTDANGSDVRRWQRRGRCGPPRAAGPSLVANNRAAWSGLFSGSGSATPSRRIGLASQSKDVDESLR